MDRRLCAKCSEPTRNSAKWLCDKCISTQNHKSVQPDTGSMTDDNTMRKFDSGATRHTDVGKLDYEGFLNPLVLRRYAEYLHKHRTQADGNVRDSDNWQQLFGDKHYDICMKSAWRHFMNWWLEHRKCVITEDGIEDAICGLMFNAQAYLLKMLKEKQCDST